MSCSHSRWCSLWLVESHVSILPGKNYRETAMDGVNLVISRLGLSLMQDLYLVKISAGGFRVRVRPVGNLQSVEDLNLRSPNTNPSSVRAGI